MGTQVKLRALIVLFCRLARMDMKTMASRRAHYQGCIGVPAERLNKPAALLVARQ